MRKFAIVVVAVALAAGLAACGDDDETSSATTGPRADRSESSENGMDMGDADHGSFSFGEPSDPDEADRTIDVDMSDDFQYDPDSIEVRVGETVAFRIHNSGKIAHEFVIGDRALQQQHEQEMQEMEGGMMMADEANAVTVEPGGSKVLAFHFSEVAELEYACHQPGHYAAGMTAPLTIS